MARYFNGSSAYLAISDDPALTIGDDIDYSGPFSFAGWLRAVGMADSSPHHFLSWGASSPLFHAYMYGTAHATAAGQIGLHLQSGQDIWYRPTNPEPFTWGDGDWHHFALTGDGTTIHMYRDGVVHAQTASMAALDAIDRSDVFYVGRHAPGASGGAYWGGDLAEWAKWDVALSSEDIAALAAGVRPVDIASRPAWYLPLFDNLYEEIQNLAVTAPNATFSEHPAKIIRAGLTI